MKITWLAPFLLTVQLCFIYGIVLGQSVETAWQSGCAGNDSEVVFYILPGPNCSSFPNVTSPGGWVVNPSSGVTIMPIETGPGTYNQVRMKFANPGLYLVWANYTCSFGGGSGSATPKEFDVDAAPGPPSLTISADKTTICGNGSESVTFTANPTNGGSSPSYEWRIGGVLVPGEFDDTFVANSSHFSGSKIVTATLYANGECTSSSPVNSINSIQVSIAPQPEVTVEVHMTNPNNEVCPGGGVAFIASITNGGSSPIIEWKINGSPAPASDVPEMGPSYLIYNSWNYPDSTPVQCFVKSSLACASTQSVGSEVINVGLTGTQAFWVGIEVQPERYPPVYCEDEVTFVAHPSHPATIYWYKGEQQVATGNTYDPVTFDASDVLTVKAYAAANPCLQNDFAETTLNEFFSIEDPVGEVTVNVLGPPYRCTGTGQSNFFAVADNSKNFSWSIIPLGAGTITPNMTNNSSAVVEWNPAFIGEATIKATASGCGSDTRSDEFSFDVYPREQTPQEIALSYCHLEFPILKHSGEDAPSFNWYENDGTFLGSGAYWQLDELLSPGSYTYQVESVSRYGCPSPGRANVYVTITANCDDNLNWIETIAFTREGQYDNIPYHHSKSFFDHAGKPLQSQARQFSHSGTGSIFATQGLRDRYDRVVGSTLDAPIDGNDFKYNHYFVQDANSGRYDVSEFDDPDNNTILAPEPVDNQSPGTLGWYYSDNNTLEDYVPVTDYPYSRTEFYDDGSDEVKRSASPGNMHRLGMGHEMLSGTFPVYDELDDYLVKRRLSGLPDQQGDNTLEKEGVQSVMRDENGKYSVSITDKMGRTVMMARKGTSTDYILQITNSVSANLDEGSPNFRPLTYLYILDDQNITINADAGSEYTIEDIVAGTGYTPSGNTWAAGFYRIVLHSGSISFSYTNYYLDVAYQFYDDAGRLRYSISPNGYAQWIGGTSFSKIDKTSFEYNHRGWLLAMTEPDAGRTEYIYRKDGKIRFSQNAEQAIVGHFSYTHYDQLGRPVESGEYVGSTVAFKSQAMVNMLEYHGQVFWTGSDINDWVRTNYDLPGPTIPHYGSSEQEFVRSAVSWTENSNITTWYSYDELGRVTWMAQKPKAFDRTFVVKYAYDFLGNVTTVVTFSVDNSGEADRFFHKYEYDADKRLVRTYAGIDANSPKLTASYFYYLHGPLKRIELGEKLQGIDFVYNINGWLTQINHPDVSKDPGDDGSAGDHADYRKDVFGMLIDYYESEMGVFQGAYSPEGNDPNRFHRLPTLESLDEGYLNAFIPTPSYHERDGGNGVLNTLQQIRDAIEETSSKELPHLDSKKSEGTGMKVGSAGTFGIEDFDPTIDPKSLLASTENVVYEYTAPVFEGNGLSNNEFDQGTTGWTFYDWTGDGNSFSVVQDAALSGANAAKVDIASTDNSGWMVQLRNTVDFDLQVGTTYEISFIARAESPRKIRALLTGAPSNATYWNSGDINLTTEAQVYGPFQYTCNNANAANDDTFYFRFYLAYGIASDVWLDKIIIVDKTNASGAAVGVNVTPLKATMAVGQSLLLLKTVLPTNATNQNVSWSSDNTSVATVNSSGLVEAVAPGTATITVTTADGSHTAASAITVLPAGNNNVKNYEFDEGTSNWVLYNWASGGGAAFSVVQGQDMSGTNAAHLQIDNTDNSGWKIQFNQHLDFMLEVGRTYEVSFMARAEAPRKIRAGITATPSTTEYWNSGDVNLTTENKVFGPYQFTINNANVANESYFNFKFYLAYGTATDVWIDKVIIVDKTVGAGAVAGVNVNPLKATIAEEQGVQLAKTVLPTNAGNQNVSWSSDNTSVATVDNSGLVTAVSTGTATITATTADGGHTASSEITVLPGGSNNVKNPEFDSGTSSWRLSDWSSTGATFSVVQDADLSGANAVYVDVKDDENEAWKLSLAQDLDFDLQQGRTYEISFMARAESPRQVGAVLGGSTQNTAYWISNVDLTTVPQTFGPYTFTAGASVSNETAFYVGFYLAKGVLSDVWIDKVIVVDKTDGSGVVAGVSVAPREITLANGQSSLLTTTILPSNAANQSVTWSSDNTSVADVDTAGKVTAAAPGSAVITATTVDGGFTATSTVTVHPEGTNAIKNHQFDDDSEWVLYDWSSEGGSTWSIVQDAQLSGSNAAWITPGNLDNSGWKIQLNQHLDFLLEQGRTYEVSFMAKAASPRKIRAGITATPSQAEYWNSGDINLTTEKQVFGPFQFTVNQPGVVNESFFNFKFYLAYGSDIEVWVDKVVIVDKTVASGVVAGINVAPLSTKLPVGQNLQLVSTILPTNAANQNVTWSSDNPSVASVNASGLVAGVSPGTATVTVTTTDGGYTAMSQIAVVPPRSNLVRNDEFDDGMAEWDLRDWTDGGGSTWSVIQDSTVSGPNAAHIALGNADDSKWKIQLQQHLDFRLQEGKTYQISFMARAESPRKIRATFSGAPSNTVYWSSGDVQLSTASQVYGPFEYTCDDSNVANDSFFIFDFYLAFGIESDVWIDKVIIVDKGGSGDVAGVNVAPLMASVQAGQNLQLTETILPTNSANQAVTWASDDIGVATVDSTGLVTGVSPGTALITVTTSDGAYTATSTIHVTPGGGNLVANSEFDEGATDWVLYDWASGGGSTLAIVQDADLSGSNAAKATIGNTDNSGWKIKLQQHLNFRLELGKTYEISFIARAASPRKIKAAFSGSPSTSQYWNSGDINLTTEAQVYGPFEFTCNNANVDNESYFVFDFYLAYGVLSNVWIDKVVIVDRSAASGQVAAINIAPLKATLATSQVLSLSKMILPTDAANQAVVWISSDSTVASVDSDGRVRGNSAGVATITATTADGNHTASSAITVTSAGSGTLANSDFDEGAKGWILYDWTSGGGNSLSVVQDAGMSGPNAAYIDVVNADNSNWTLQLRQGLDFRLEVGRTYEISFMAKAQSARQIQPAIQGGPSNTVYWSNNVNVTTEAQSFGPFQYTCNNIAVEGEEGFAFKFFLAKGVISDVWIDSVIIRDVTVIPVAGINVSQPTVNLATGQSGQLAAFTIPAYASNQTFTWSSSNTSVAKVSSTGVITPVSPGSAIITVTSADGTHTAQSEVTVTVGPEGIVPDAIEFAALKDIYDNLGGPNWTNKTNWPSPGNWPASATITQMDSWFGITVANGDVTQVVLDINNLNGTIPESVGDLLGLKRIDFGENDISGALPESLVSLTNLEDLRLNDNHLTGHIPENIGVLSKLKVLDFGRNNLTGTIPESIGNLTGLTWLALYINDIEGTIPDSLYNLTNLTNLYIHSTRISGPLSESIGNLTKLQKIWAYATDLSGPLPESMGNIAPLKEIWMHSTNFSGEIPENWQNLTNLEHLVLHWTNISGELPEWIGQLTKMTSLSVGDNYMYGTIPTTYAAMVNLEELYLERLNLSGTIPDELQSLNKLAIIDLKFSNLEGGIPSWLMNKATTKEFRLNDNKFTSLPDFSSRSDKAQLIINIENNQIPFEDIERYFNSNGTHPFQSFTYAPQRPSVVPPKLMHVSLNSQLKIEAPSGGIYGEYLWEKRNGSEWVDITALNEGTEPNVFIINNVAPEDAGSYRYTVSNSRVPDLVFQVPPIAVQIVDPQGPDYVGPRYNGIISSVTWRTEKAYGVEGEEFMGTYLYRYDNKYQILEANFANPVFGGTSGYVMQGNKFRLTGMQYDPNGNILALKRYNDQGLRHNDFSYSYHNSFSAGHTSGAQETNKLKSVSGYADSYMYNAIGQMIYSETNNDFELDDEVFDYGGGFDGETSETALQADGRVITTGDFTSYDGTTAPGIVRINQDGTLDQTFDVGTGFNGDVNSVVVQTDGKVVLGGAFTSYDGTSVGRIIRLNTDGSVDNSFGGGTRFTNGVVNSLALQADGKILVAGSFTSYNGSTANRIVRLNTNGTVDTSFATGSGFDGPADIVITLPIGIVLVQGSFTSYDGTSVSNLVELSEDGVYWSTYIPGTAFGNGPVEQLRLVMPGAKVLAGGSFTSFDGTSAAGIARINSSGSLDQSFVYGSGFNGPVYEVTLQPDGKTLVGGAFTSYNGTSANNIIRINSDGTVDNSFDYGSGFNGDVKSIVVRSDGKILVNGSFTSYNGTAANRIILLDPDGGASHDVSENEASVSRKFVRYDVTGKIIQVYEGDEPITEPVATPPTGYQLKVAYFYDDRGFRMAKVNHETQRTTWYVRDASGNILSIYEQEGVVTDVAPTNTNPVVQTEVPIYGSGKLGTYYPIQDGSIAYEITDHLGNVRALLRDNITRYVATMEDNGTQDITNPAVEETLFFENVNETRVADGRMNYTQPIGSVVPSPDKSAYLYWVDGMAGMEAEDKAIGPAIALKVNAGDSLTIETWYRYEEKLSYDPLDLATLASLLGGTFADVQGFEGYSQSQTSQNLLGAFQVAGYPASGDDTKPYAFLNYITYDEQMAFVDAGWVRVSDEGAFEPGQEGNPGDRDHAQLTFSSPIEITENGYIYIWVSNQSEETKIWFDDLTVTHMQTLVVQATDYGVWGDVMREQKSDESVYRFGYQGQFAEKDEETGWSHFELREYDALIGRFTTVDPAGQFYSPYIGIGNDPINGVDPTGGCVDDEGKLIPCGGVADGMDGFHTTILDEITISADVNYSFDADFSEKDWIGSYGKYTQMYPEFAEIPQANARAYWDAKYSQAYAAWWAQKAKEERDREVVQLLTFWGTALTYTWGAGYSSPRLPSYSSFSYSPRGMVRIHGNSLNSPRPTWGYKLYRNDGTFLKNGITSKLQPRMRYSKSFMRDKYMEATQFPNRRAAWEWEYQENLISPGPWNKNMH